MARPSETPAAPRYGASADTRDDVTTALKALSSRVLGVDTMVLFGSRARGDAHPFSDVDLLVDGAVTQEVAAWTYLRGQLIDELGRPVELLSIAEAEQMPGVLADALRDGLVIKDVHQRWRVLERDRARIVAAAEAEHATYSRRREAALAVLRQT